jgi:hypothetical protein
MPFEPSQFQSMRDSFAAQFKIDDRTISYRKNGTGEGVIISSSEYDQFIEDFDRHLAKMKWHLWGWISGIIVVATALAIRFQITDNRFYFLIGIPLLVFLAWMLRANYRALVAPAVQLANRLPSAPTITPLEARRRWLKERDWSTFALGPAGALLIGYKSKLYEAPFALGNIFWTVMVAAILGLFGLQAVRKWRIEREDRPDHSE